VSVIVLRCGSPSAIHDSDMGSQAARRLYWGDPIEWKMSIKSLLLKNLISRIVKIAAAGEP